MIGGADIQSGLLGEAGVDVLHIEPLGCPPRLAQAIILVIGWANSWSGDIGIGYDICTKGKVGIE